MLRSYGPWVALAALAFWTSGERPAALFVAAGGVAAAALAPRGRGLLWGVGVAVLVVAILVGFYAHRQVDGVLSDWDGYWADRVSEIEVDLNAELDRRQAAGEQASDALAALWEGSRSGIDPGEVAELRDRSGSSALALYDPTGALVVWDGVHRGRVPEDVQRGDRRHAYRDLPLFGYLYVTSLADDGSVAVAAYLLRAALPEGLRADARDLVARFEEETGERIRITEDDPGIAEVVWDLALDDDRLLSVVLEPPAATERAARIMDAWRVRVAVLVVLGGLLVALAGPKTAGAATAAALGLISLAAWLPVDQLAALGNAFDPELFGLPGPVPLTLGRFTLLCIVSFTLVAVLPRPRPRLAPALVAALAALAYPAVLTWVGSGTAPTALAGARFDWVVYETGLASLLALITGTVLGATRDGPGSRAALLVGVGLAAGLALALPAWVGFTASYPWWVSAAWAVPVGLAAWGLRSWTDWRRAVLRWSVAIVLGGSAAVPVAWADRFEARLAEGARTLETVRAARHPELEDALLGFGRLADSLDAAGAIDVTILYDGWLRSGLAELGHPVWLQIHRRDGTPGESLRVGVEGAEPEPLGQILADGWALGGTRLVHLNRVDARYVLTTRLADDDLVSAVAPPLPVGATRSVLGSLLSGTGGDGAATVSVLPLLPEDDRHGVEPVPVRTRAGWQVEIGLDFDEGPAYHAHYLVDLPGALLTVARGSLILVMNLLLLVAFWVLGRALIDEPGGRDVRVSELVISFRARVTLALFGFFALANALFGTVAYRTLDQASRRSAQVIAERVLEDAAGWYRTLGGEMERLATQVGAELLEYRDAELREGSVEELVELGLYEAWIPHDLYVLLESREIEQEFAESRVGRWEYVTAFRRLPDGDVLAAQVPLQAGTSALQTTDLIELLGFVVLVGAALSLALAMMAGRALTRPIHALSVASESVGAGDLGLRLPSDRADEFGAVFRAFNRMVGRVRRARRQLVRTSRRTQLIMDEAAVGMVALDASGRVTLVNPRAEDLLGARVLVGRRLPAEGELGEALADWLGTFLGGSSDEATTDVQVGERRVRVRARRLGGTDAGRGAVVAMDDVTDELRAERVLAWGEMARQVAHEVKNPLTPIKLSIQHVRRAWEDRRPDFEEILVKNADAMLSEIDRLAGIAQSFSRFGAPGDQVIPLEGVRLGQVVGEVMALYGGAAGGIRFGQELESDLPPVVARSAELKEVLVNLLENARLAGQDGTSVSILGRRGPEGTVVLAVVDDGHGIPEDVLPRIFEPQFSTRSTGTGLGLAIVQRVVRAWGGSVSVASVLGEGTTVSVSMRVWPDGEA